MIVLDVETTGWDFRTHGLLSIGAVDFDNPSNTFYGECQLREGAKVSLEALEVNGFSNDSLRDSKKLTEKELLARFDAWTQTITNKTLAGHGIGFFDMLYLKDLYERNGEAWPFLRRSVDLHSVAYAYAVQNNIEIPLKNGTSDLSLDSILKLLGLPQEPKPHLALNGAKYEAEALSRLMNTKSLFPEFGKYPVK